MSLFGLEPLQPAYGRDYKSLKQAQIDFNADKDFATAMGQYINKPQVVDMNMSQIRVRYDSNRKTGFLKVN